MNGCDIVKLSLETTRDHLLWLIGDFSDADLLVRPVPEANHTAWQVGNIIVGDVFLVRMVVPDAAFPELPAGFMDLHGNAGAKQTGPKGFLTKAEYTDLFQKVRAVSISAVDQFTDADLANPTPEAAREYAPTLAHLFLMVAHHTLMHTGQFTVIRRLLNKPVLF